MRLENPTDTEETIYDVDGVARAYVRREAAHESIHTFDGGRVAVVRGEELYRQDGRHIGWYVRGVMYDGDGKRIGFTRRTCPSPTVRQPTHLVRESHAASLPPARFGPSVPKPPLGIKTSNLALAKFLDAGTG